MFNHSYTVTDVFSHDVRVVSDRGVAACKDLFTKIAPIVKETDCFMNVMFVLTK